MWMLASAASNQGLDNLLEKLIDAEIEDLQILRVGNPNYCRNPKANSRASLPCMTLKHYSFILQVMLL